MLLALREVRDSSDDIDISLEQAIEIGKSGEVGFGHAVYA